MTGSLLLGIILGTVELGPGTAQLAAIAGTGFCGGFTTFSAFGFETIRLVGEGSTLEATLNITASLAVGLLAALAGWGIAQLIWA